MNELFRKFAGKAATATGSAWAFIIAMATVIIWAISGPFMHFSEIWQLTINTGTTIVTFLMVFLIQNAQNRDSQALHLKLDELLRANDAARSSLINLETLSDDDLAHLQKEFERLQARPDTPLADHADELSDAIEEVEQARVRR